MAVTGQGVLKGNGFFQPGRGVIENNHSTDVESPPPPPPPRGVIDNNPSTDVEISSCSAAGIIENVCSTD